MFQLLDAIRQVAVAIGSNPNATYVTCRLLMGAKQGYDRLSPQTKAKVDSIMIDAAGFLARSTLGDVLDWGRGQAQTMGLSSEAAEVAQLGIRRVAEVGITKAQAELRR